MNVSEIARHTQHSPDAVRYYVRTGLLIPRRDARNGYHIFADAHVRELRFIHAAKRLGFTLAEIREILARIRGGRSPCVLVRELLEKRIIENRGEIDALRALQKRMENASKRWRSLPDDLSATDVVSHFIEIDATEE